METLKELIADAKILAHYGALTGKIRDTALLSAIADVEKLPNPAWTDEPMIRLLSTLGDGMQVVAPLTLMDLRDWKPDRPRRGFFQFQPLLITLSFVLMLATFYSTSLYSRGTLILDQVVKLKTENANWEFNKTVLDIIQVGTPDKASGTVDRERYIEYVQKLRDLNDRASTYTSAARDYRNNDLGLLLANAATQFSFLLKPYVVPTAVAGEPAGTPDPRSISTKLREQDACDTKQTGAVVTAATVPAGEGAPALSLAAETTSSPATGSIGTTDQDVGLEYWTAFQKIICLNQIGSVPDMRLLDVIVSDLQIRTGTLALWLLPALYGALGASVFYMRRVLDPTLPDPPLPRLVYRIALGGFAGIIFGWFWQPTSEFNSRFANIGINVFGWAFLVGFSVEVFFALLDRLVTVLTAWARRIGATPTDTALPTSQN